MASPSYWEDHGRRKGVTAETAQVIPLSDIAGLYRWVWCSDADKEWYYKAEQLQDLKTLSKLVFEVTDDNTSEPASVRGCFDIGYMHGTFSKLARVPETKNVYELHGIDLGEDDYTKSLVTPYGNVLKILDAQDDDGNRFLSFEFNTGWQGCRPETGGWMVAKRCTGPRWLRMSDRERFALGMEVDDEELQRRAWQRAGVPAREPVGEEKTRFLSGVYSGTVKRAKIESVNFGFGFDIEKLAEDHPTMKVFAM
ncbi:hypothetical protein EIP91_000607 [Steccherinum ochraceum]|uniref:Uncharacterized protein n=1 Tax=Steccherinum ochraceum TaxID=92696 RepID=A0A4R0RM17_9APHY|nr:hypothetical protein EIP91_000607 [Steccherinum ochraceum]